MCTRPAPRLARNSQSRAAYGRADALLVGSLCGNAYRGGLSRRGQHRLKAEQAPHRRFAQRVRLGMPRMGWTTRTLLTLVYQRLRVWCRASWLRRGRR
jgi:hypothetical protein